MLMDKLRRLFARKEIPTDARELLKQAKSPKELLHALDELVTTNELEVNTLNREIEALEKLETTETKRVRGGDLPDRSKNNALRKIQRLRKQMDNLEERLKIYNRNINLQIHLVGRIQSLEAMEMRGVDEDQIDQILTDYEEELSSYQNVLESEELLVGDIGPVLDDSADLKDLEREILGPAAEPAPEPDAKEPSSRAAAAPPAEKSAPAKSESSVSQPRAPEKAPSRQGETES